MMIKHYILAISLLFVFFAQLSAEEVIKRETKSIDLKYITGNDVISVLETLIDDSVSVSEKDNVLLLNGTSQKIKNILPIIEQIDSPPTPLTIEFIASNRKVDFNLSSNSYQSRSNTSQSMAITERQWVTLNTGLSIPIAERRRSADGTETQSFKYKNINKSYIFKVHEFSGWSIIQVGVNSSSLSDDIAGAIQHTKLDTTIVGKTGEWLEVASSNKISENKNSQTYSTNRENKSHIFLYIKVIKPKSNNETIINNEIKTETNK